MKIVVRTGVVERAGDVVGVDIGWVFFCVHDGHMALLHGFIKKRQKTPAKELEIAEKRMRGLKS